MSQNQTELGLMDALQGTGLRMLECSLAKVQVGILEHDPPKANCPLAPSFLPSFKSDRQKIAVERELTASEQARRERAIEHAT